MSIAIFPMFYPDKLVEILQNVCVSRKLIWVQIKHVNLCEFLEKDNLYQFLWSVQSLPLSWICKNALRPNPYAYSKTSIGCLSELVRIQNAVYCKLIMKNTDLCNILFNFKPSLFRSLRSVVLDVRLKWLNRSVNKAGSCVNKRKSSGPVICYRDVISNFTGSSVFIDFWFTLYLNSIKYALNIYSWKD